MSNLEIKRIIKNSSNDSLKNNFVGGFASDQIIYFASFYSLIKEKITDSKISLFKYKHGQIWTIYNQFHNNLRIFDVLPNFPFMTNETMCSYYL